MDASKVKPGLQEGQLGVDNAYRKEAPPFMAESKLLTLIN